MQAAKIFSDMPSSRLERAFCCPGIIFSAEKLHTARIMKHPQATCVTLSFVKISGGNKDERSESVHCLTGDCLY